MAEQEGYREERTEAASARRTQMAAAEGQIVLSRDLALWMGLLFGVMALLSVGAALRDAMVRMVVAAGNMLSDPNPRALAPYLREVGKQVVLVIAAAGAGSGLAFVAQTRGQVWPNLLTAGADRIFSGGGLKRLFSRRTAIDVGLSLVKVLGIGWVAWLALRSDFMALPRMMSNGPELQFTMLFRPLAGAAVKIMAAMAVFAGLDFAVNRYRLVQSLKMTKEEAKRDLKEEEGDPLIRLRRRRKHRELAKGRAVVEVPRADVLVVNPTHVAIALRYRPGKDRAPIVTAKGKGDLAEFMRSLARSHGIPIVENIALARLLFRKVKVGRAVPADTYKAVAAILAFVYRLTRRPSVAASAPVASSEAHP